MLLIKLKNSNIEITENTLIVGENGSGKTFLLESILKLNKNANVFYNNKEVKSCYPLFGYHNQSAFLPSNYTVEEVLKQRTKEFSAVVERFSLDINKKIHQLSGGQQQLLSVIQAFLGNNPIVILDEPLNNLDEVVKDKLIHWMREQKKLIISTNHNNGIFLSLFRNTVILENRKIIYSGDLQDAYNSKILNVSNKFGTVFDYGSFFFRPEWTRFSQDTRYESNCVITNIHWSGSFYTVYFTINNNRFHGNHYTEKPLALGNAFVNFKMRIPK